MNNKSIMEGTRVAVTGAAGTIGREIVRQLFRQKVLEVRALDNNESALFFLDEAWRDETKLQVFLSDVRDQDKLRRMFDGIDLVFHAAAFKHVPLCERSPFDAVQTNIIGVQNVINAAFANKVKRVLFTSSDKAVNPTNVMGTSKLMGERLFTAANALRRSDSDPIFSSTRFGNVAGSSGSVIPVFLKQIERGGPVTLTDRSMTRFVMTLRDAVSLVLSMADWMRGGEVFITKMPVIRIEELAVSMIDLLSPCFGYKKDDIKIVEIGPRPGEKRYEELLNEEETRRSIEFDKLFVTLPAFRNIYDNVDYSYPEGQGGKVSRPYHSGLQKPMLKEEIHDFLKKPDVLPESIHKKVLSLESLHEGC